MLRYLQPFGALFGYQGQKQEKDLEAQLVKDGYLLTTRFWDALRTRTLRASPNVTPLAADTHDRTSSVDGKQTRQTRGEPPREPGQCCSSLCGDRR